jgi:hypothetical protein
MAHRYLDEIITSTTSIATMKMITMTLMKMEATLIQYIHRDASSTTINQLSTYVGFPLLSSMPKQSLSVSATLTGCAANCGADLKKVSSAELQMNTLDNFMDPFTRFSLA